MFKLFSLQEANKLIPTVEILLDDMQGAITDVLRLRQKIALQKFNNLEVRNTMQELQFLGRVINENKAELDKLGVFIQDVETGKIDFPSQLGAEVVYLTWEKGKDAITHYHRLNEGTALPLPQYRTTKRQAITQFGALSKS
ncbi:MAG: DUF2203 domain-containing protein [Trueperaceae bacterium]